MTETRKTILIVDDETINIDILVNLLGNDYRIKVAKNGKQAIEMAQRHPCPELILMDVMMPELDGFSACEELKKIPETEDIPVMFITAKTEIEDIVKAFDVGGVDYVTKPFRPVELMARVKTHLALREAYQDLEHQLTELQVSHRKLTELDETKSKLLKKLYTLNSTHFQSLRKKLDMLWEVFPDSKVPIQQILRDFQSIEELIRPFEKLYLAEQAVKRKRILLAETDRKQQITAKMALGGTGVELDVTSDYETGQQLLEKNQYDVLCVNSELIQLAAHAYAHQPETQIVFMTSENIPTYLALLQQYPFLSNIISRNDEDRTFTLKNILTTVSKLINQDLFGLEKYLSWGVEVRQHTIVHSEDRTTLIENMEEDLMNLGVRRALVQKCSAVVEELLTNAIYDAPTNAEGQPIYNHLPRTEPVVLKSDEQGIFRYACDGVLIGVSVEDPFGAFDRKTILDYLESCYKGRAGTLQAGKGGAGRGLFQIMEIADLVIWNVKARLKTEIIALFDIDPNKFKSSKTSSFHYFSG